MLPDGAVVEGDLHPDGSFDPEAHVLRVKLERTR